MGLTVGWSLKIQQARTKTTNPAINSNECSIISWLRTSLKSCDPSEFLSFRPDSTSSRGYMLLERTVGKDEKLESLNLERPKLESFHLVGKYRTKLEFFQLYSFQFHFELSKWKVPNFSFFSNYIYISLRDLPG